MLPTADGEHAGDGGHDGSHDGHDHVVPADKLAVLGLFGVHNREDGERGGVGDTPAHAGGEATERHEQRQVVDGTEAGGDDEDGESCDHDDLLVHLVAEDTGEDAEGQAHNRRTGDGEVDERLGLAGEDLVKRCGNGVDDHIAQGAHGGQGQGDERQPLPSVADVEFHDGSLLFAPSPP